MKVIRGERDGAATKAADRRTDGQTDSLGQMGDPWGWAKGRFIKLHRNPTWDQHEDAEVKTVPLVWFQSSQHPSSCDQDDGCLLVHLTKPADTFHVYFDVTHYLTETPKKVFFCCWCWFSTLEHWKFLRKPYETGQLTSCLGCGYHDGLFSSCCIPVLV